MRPSIRFWTISTILATIAVLAASCSSSSGSSSSPTPIAQLKTEDYHALVMAPGNPDKAFFGHHGGIQTTTDGGKTWTPMPGIAVDAMNLAVSPSTPQRMYLAGHEIFLKSEDGGRTWTDLPNNLPGMDLHWFGMDPDNPTHLYTNAMGFGPFQSVDGGTTWSEWDPKIPGTTPVTALAVLGGDPLNLLIGLDTGEIQLSSDGGTSWRKVASLDGTPTTFAVNPSTKAVFAGTSKGLYRSTDAGQSWSSTLLSTKIVTLTVGGSGRDRVLAINDKGELYRSDDGGQTW